MLVSLGRRALRTHLTEEKSPGGSLHWNRASVYKQPPQGKVNEGSGYGSIQGSLSKNIADVDWWTSNRSRVFRLHSLCHSGHTSEVQVAAKV